MNLQLTFTESEGALIARADNGKICFLQRHNPKGEFMVNAGETWDCEIVEEKATLFTVKPVKRILTAEQNAEIFFQKAQELKKQFS
jgi:hypothetical protein